MLDIYAGETARKVLTEHGLKPELFNIFLGASGGPKWFSLYELDRYVFGDFFAGRSDPLHIIGSSAGAFRAACFSHHDPVAAIDRLAKHYSETTYTEQVDRQEITAKARDLLANLFGDDGVRQVVNNPIYQAHFFVNRCYGLAASENKTLQMLGLTKSFTANMLSRGLLRGQYQRVIFANQNSQLRVGDPCQFDTISVPLSESNTADALLASGSIPLVMEGIKDIAGAPRGMYRDGGIVDYHFDIDLTVKPSDTSTPDNHGLILYPHFSAKPKAGWFDKNLNRSPSHQHYDRTVMLVPSDQFIASLPYKKIPDRTDFKNLSDDERFTYWQTVFKETSKLAESFDHSIRHFNKDLIKPLPF
ncbi:MAG: hypothetical protein V2I33_07930 [Kangiellaceae bacterium]|jgi:hypothetical protein|nr:hypothetical protein [Kangiellaceae bacterium]